MEVDLQQVVGVLLYGCVDTGHTLSVTHVEEGASTEARVERAIGVPRKMQRGI